MRNNVTLESMLPRKGRRWKEKLYFSKQCFSLENALELYQYLKLALLDVGNWNNHRAGISLHAELTDHYGHRIGRIAQTGDRIKIVLSRMLSVFQAHEWFEIKRIEERLSGNAEFFFIRIISSGDPAADIPQIRVFPKQEWEISIFVIQDENKLELQIHNRDNGRNFQGMTMKARLKYTIDKFFIQRRFYKKQLGNLLKGLVAEGSSNFTNLN